MGKNFLISGYGRSGTKFLSSLMNKSTEWTVLHEPRGADDEINGKVMSKRYLNKVQSDFKEKYGEVNSYLRYYFKYIDVNKKGILLRNPEKIFLSVCNRKHISTWGDYLREIDEFYNYFLSLRDNPEIKLIYFEKIISDVEYTNAVFNYFNITDVKLTEEDLKKKVNQNKQVLYKTLQDLPPKTRKNINKILGENVKLYNDLLKNK